MNYKCYRLQVSVPRNSCNKLTSTSSLISFKRVEINRKSCPLNNGLSFSALENVFLIR